MWKRAQPVKPQEQLKRHPRWPAEAKTQEGFPDEGRGQQLLRTGEQAAREGSEGGRLLLAGPACAEGSVGQPERVPLSGD